MLIDSGKTYARFFLPILLLAKNTDDIKISYLELFNAKIRDIFFVILQ